MDAEALQQFTELEHRKRQLKTELKEVNEKLGHLNERLLRQFEREGVQNINVNGMTVYVHRQLWANAAGDKQQAVDALKGAGLVDYVAESFNSQSLSAWVREQVALADDDDLDDIYDALPPEFRDAINVTERFELRTRLS